MIALVVNSRRHARHTYLCCSVCHPLLVSRESSESKDCSINDLLPVSPPCYPVCFHTNTNCPICKPFVLITMQQYPGVGGRLAPTLLKKDFNSLPIRSATALTYLGTPHPPEARAGILLSSVGCQLWAVNPSARSSAFHAAPSCFHHPLCFHNLAHSFAPRAQCNSFGINSLRTLSIVTGVYTHLHVTRTFFNEGGILPGGGARAGGCGGVGRRAPRRDRQGSRGSPGSAGPGDPQRPARRLARDTGAPLPVKPLGSWRP